jgi:glutaredoxin 3
MAFIEIYTRAWCLYSARAKALLQAKGLNYQENDITGNWANEQEIVTRIGRCSVPQIFIDGLHVGGWDELAAIYASGELDLIAGEVSSADGGTEEASDQALRTREAGVAAYRADLHAKAPNAQLYPGNPV